MTRCKPKLVLFFSLSIFSLTWNVVMGCSLTHTSKTGVIHQKGNAYCIHTIRVAAGYRIKLSWMKLYIPGTMPQCTSGYVRITQCNPVKYYIRYCDVMKATYLFSYDNCMRVDVLTRGRKDEYVDMRWDVVNITQPYFSPPGRSELDVQPTGSRQKALNIFSPNWPMPYNGALSSREIRHTIYVGEGNAVKLFFMGLDLYVSKQAAWLCNEPRNDVLELRGVAINGTEIAFRFCGQQRPFTRYYKNVFRDHVDIILRRGTADRHNRTGFALGIVFMDAPRANKEEGGISQSGIVAAIVIPIIIMGLALVWLRTQSVKVGGCRAFCHHCRGDKTSHATQHIDLEVFTLPEPVLNLPPPYPPPAYAIVTTHGEVEPSAPYFKQELPPTEIAQCMPPPYGTGTSHPLPGDGTLYDPPAYDTVTYQSGNVGLTPVYNSGM